MDRLDTIGLIGRIGASVSRTGGASGSVGSNSMRMMEKSMDYLWAKQAAHLDNIANAETPDYKVKTVYFEDTFEKKLKAAAEEGSKPRANMREAIEGASWKVVEDGEVTRQDGNGVNVLEQSLEAVRTAYQLQYLMKSISNDFTLLSKAVNA